MAPGTSIKWVYVPRWHLDRHPESNGHIIADGGRPQCPMCDEPAGEVSWQTAPGQEGCINDECPINTWDDRVHWIEFDCKDCDKHVSRPPSQMDIDGLTPVRCASCTLERMAEP
jgi:hypothetical protein